MYQGWLTQNFCALLVVVLNNCGGDYLSPSDPTAQRYQNDQVLVGMRLHGGFHFVLRGFKFLLESVPFIVFGKFINAAAATEELFAHTKCLCQFDNVRPDILDLLAILC